MRSTKKQLYQYGFTGLFLVYTLFIWVYSVLIWQNASAGEIAGERIDTRVVQAIIQTDLATPGPSGPATDTPTPTPTPTPTGTSTPPSTPTPSPTSPPTGTTTPPSTTPPSTYTPTPTGGATASPVVGVTPPPYNPVQTSVTTTGAGNDQPAVVATDSNNSSTSSGTTEEERGLSAEIIASATNAINSTYLLNQGQGVIRVLMANLPPKQEINFTLNSNPIDFVAVSDGNGKVDTTVAANLESGSHSLTVGYQDPTSGKKVTVRTSFKMPPAGATSIIDSVRENVLIAQSNIVYPYLLGVLIIIVTSGLLVLAIYRSSLGNEANSSTV